MRLGVMTKHTPRASTPEIAAAVHALGLATVQFSMDDAGWEPLPAAFDAVAARQIADAFAAEDITIAALSGTFNMIDPDTRRRAGNIARFPVLLEWCRALHCSVITACTGTRHPTNMWRYHPDNERPESWADLHQTLDHLLPAAEAAGIVIAFEPEVVNVVDTAEKAQRLIAEYDSPYLRIVMDPANYFHPAMLPHRDAVLQDVFDRLGAFIALAHAKDVRLAENGGAECVRPAAGKGVLDYERYLRLLRQSGYDGALVLHSLTEEEMPSSIAYVRRFL